MRDDSTVALNRRARHEFTIDETFEAGIVLTGTEIKSIRAGKVNISERLRPDREGRGVAHRRRHRAVRAGQSVQPRTKAHAQALVASTSDRRAARSRPAEGPDHRARSAST